MTPVAEMLRDEIASSGPVLFSHFMEAALYHPEYGYYRRSRDPFGIKGDFFTAEQLQPVFGRLLAQLFGQLGRYRTVVELGAGRREMEAAFAGFDYIPVDVAFGALPDEFDGFVLANEFFDALPVDVVVMRGGFLRQVRVGWGGDRFAWVEGETAGDSAAAFVEEAAGELEEGSRIEVNLRACEWIERIAGALASGFAFVLDYGYSRREAVRFPDGTLMSYRRHCALEDVLVDPGERDITAHVAFGALEAQARRSRFEVLRNESMAAALIRAGEPDQFTSALAAADEREALRLRMQLKTLLYGMGETFRTVLLSR